MVQFAFNLITPRVPNFILLDAKISGARQGETQELPKVAVGDLSNGQLEVIAELWKKALFENAQRQRALKGHL